MNIKTLKKTMKGVLLELSQKDSRITVEMIASVIESHGSPSQELEVAVNSGINPVSTGRLRTIIPFVCYAMNSKFEKTMTWPHP